jgi:transcriptional regulator with XRE-family HTH domain
MILKQPEIIQILRRRANISQGVFGARAFKTSFESGRTKIKNIELGRQTPTKEDLNKMAKELNVAIDELLPANDPKYDKSTPVEKGLYIIPKVLDMFPGLGSYLEMMNNAAMLDDNDLIEYISEKVSEILKKKPAEHAVSI